ncbi:DoxX family protein [Fibrella forsythiae]|uniref:DoxX family protein n=1 Tax=Fibrella forsythiae TaxID=2817061 RepID=A0ABS3JEE9_9BACT|nr:DoxX family protein [Fibrella forsythiae]MBO0948379.1 DoxX family protein [Fibrella forsythiae]
MSPKVYRIVTIIFTVLAAGMALMSGVFKFTQSPQVMETLAKVGVEKQVLFLGAMEVGFALLFLYPKTMKLGFILLSCYFAGAIATELSHGMPLNAVTPIVLVWIATYLRDKTAFLSDKTTIA